MTAITVADLDNAKLDVDHIAEIANSTSPTANDRLGHTKLTVLGAMERLTSINFRGAWATATAYAVKDAFSEGGVIYVAALAHTSTTISADLAAGKIGLYQGVATANTDEFFDGSDYTAGVTTDLTLSRDPGTKENITVHFGSAYQGPNQFDLTGTTLSFNSPIPVGITEVFVQIGRLQSSVTPSSRSVGDDQLAWGDVLSRTVDSVANIRSLNSSVYKRAFAMGYYEPLGSGGGTFFVDESDTTSADNGGTILVGADGARWRRKLTMGRISVMDFGARGIGSAFNDSPRIQAAIDALDPFGELEFDEAPGYYNLLSPVTFPAVSGLDSGLTVRGCGIGSLLRPGAAIATMFNIPGKNVRVEGLFFWNQSSYATTAIAQETSSADAGLSGRYSKNYIIGFTNGILFSGQNFTFDENWMQDNANDFRCTNDGRNSSFFENYLLGGNNGYVFEKSTQQAEGVLISGGKTLKTAGSGAAIVLNAGLDITIFGQVIDQTGTNSIGIYMPVSGGNAVAKVKVIGGWIAGGENQYAIFGSGNIADLSVDGASIMSNNSLTLSSGISLNGTNGFKLTNCNFGVVGGADLSMVSVSNHTRMGNTSSQGGGSNAVGNYSDHEFVSAERVMGLNFEFPNGVKVLSGTGTPNGTVSAPAGSIFLRSDGGVSGHIYIGQGGTSWSAITGV